MCSRVLCRCLISLLCDGVLLVVLQISYNLCNLPKQITAEDGTLVNYTYFADGTKFKAVDATGNGFAYTGSLRWSVENGALVPDSVAITGGRAVFENNSNRISKSQS